MSLRADRNVISLLNVKTLKSNVKQLSDRVNFKQQLAFRPQKHENWSHVSPAIMEKHLDRVMEETVAKPGVFGCVFVDHQGLCLGTKGKASTESAGLIAAIATQAAKLEPHHEGPVITLETDSKSCIIQRAGTVTGAIYKNIN